MKEKLAKWGVFLAMLTLFAVGNFGFLHAAMMSDGKMDDCPFAIGGALCTMPPLDHVGAVQAALQTLPLRAEGLLLLAALAFGAVALVLLFAKDFSPPPRRSRFRRLFSSGSFFVSLRGFFEQAFSSGILNPKPF